MLPVNPNHREQLGSAPVRRIALGIALGIGGVAVVWYLARPLAILLLGITLAEALSPIVDWGCRWMSRRTDVIVTYVVILGVLVLDRGHPVRGVDAGAVPACAGASDPEDQLTGSTGVARDRIPT